MSNVESKPWNWKALEKNKEKIWLDPCIESYYFVNRWKSQNKENFLDLGCGLGRHTIQFAKAGFKTSAFDLSEEAVKRTAEYAKKENLSIDTAIGDMLSLPYADESMDCIFCRNVISHTDTKGMLEIADEIKRILKKDGECYLTLGSKDSWGFKQDWPVVDENTKIRIEDGPENGIPHFFADYDLIKKIFKDFSIERIFQVENFHEKGDGVTGSYHYHVLIRK